MFYHYSVDHGKGKYVDGRIYTNTIEGFWSIFKRGIIGIYHHISKSIYNYMLMNLPLDTIQEK